MGYLRQDPRQHRAGDDDLRSRHVLSGARARSTLARRLEKAAGRTGRVDPTSATIARFSHAEEEFRCVGGYAAEAEVRRIVPASGWRDDRLDLPIERAVGR